MNTSFLLFKRIMSRNREAYTLKVAALSMALATAIIVILFSIHEFGYDTVHHQAREVFRVIRKNTDGQYTGNRLSAKIDPEFIKQLTTDYRDSLVVSRVKIMERVTVITEGKPQFDQKVHAVDTTIDRIFPFKVIDGNINNFNSQQTPSVILSSAFVREHWNTTKVAGRHLQLYTFDDTLDVSIAAVFEAFPDNTHESFDILISFDAASIECLHFNPAETSVYGRTLFNDPAHYHFPNSEIARCFLQPVTQIYFGPRILGEAAKHGDRYSVNILICITALILFLTVTTFVNLTTITLPHRAKELAVKKLAGISRTALVLGFVRESSAVVVLSLLIGLLMLLCLDRFIAPIIGFPIIQKLIHPDFLFVLTLTLVLVTLIASPVLMTIRFVKATPNHLLRTDTITFPALKRYITFIQLGISIFLIIASVVVRRQINYSLVKEPGQNHDQIVYFAAPDGITNEGINTMRNGWKKYNPNILDVIALTQLPDRVASKEVNSTFYQLAVDPGFRDFFNLNMEEGQWFDPNSADSAFIVNRAAQEKLKGQAALGVIADINDLFNQPQKPIKVKRGNDYRYNWLCVRILEVDIRRTVQRLSADFSTGNNVVHVQYLSTHFKTWIDYQDRLNRLSGILSLIAGLLSCCAIYALSVSLVKDKLKQIAVHQLFGATAFNVAVLLISDFTKQLMLALITFLPISYLLLNELLRTFVYATHLSWIDPIYPIGYCVVVIVVICGFQAWHLKRMNAILALKG